MGYVDSYDSYHKDADRIYTFSFNEDGRTTVGNERTRTNGDIFYNLFRNLGERGQLDALGVESFMYYDENQGFNYNDQDLCLCIDSVFLDFFHPVLLTGDWSFMEDPTKIAITKSRAEREYGDESPIGKVISKRNNSYTISAVVDDLHRIRQDNFLYCFVPAECLVSDLPDPVRNRDNRFLTVVSDKGVPFGLKNGGFFR